MAGEQLKVVCNSMRRSDADVVRKLTQLRKEQEDNPVLDDKPGGKDTDQWMASSRRI